MKITEEILLERAKSYLPKGFPVDVIKYVEIDTDGNSERPDGISYWVYIKNGYKTEKGRGCHTIHEDNLKELRIAMKNIVEVEE